MLCRVRDFALAREVVDVIKETLFIGHCSVRSISKDKTECEDMLSLWNGSRDQHSSAHMPLTGSDIGKDTIQFAEKAKNAKSFADCMPFLFNLTGDDGPMKSLLLEISTMLNGVDIMSKGPSSHAGSQAGMAASSRKCYEPTVHYAQEEAVPPGQISLPVGWAGTLLWGGLSHVLNLRWLQWRGVTHVLNCLGSKDGNTQDSRVLPDPNYALPQNAHFDGIEYMDWCIHDKGDRNNYLPLFNRLGNILTCPGACLYVHCKKGSNLNAVTVLALLRLHFGVPKKQALDQVLDSRKGLDGTPCAQLGSENHIMQWIDDLM